MSLSRERSTPFFPSKKWRRSTIPTKLHLLDLGVLPIFEQLQIEEALLRGSNLNVCIVNRGSPRAIVMGISGNPESLLNLEKVQQDNIPVIRRFSGGGTVIVDEDTLFFTFIFAKDDVLHIHAFPEPILRWSGELYAASFHIPGFHLIENDYAIGSKKCGGNAQYIKKDRWLHHTSFLWDYQEKNMEYLLLPTKRPRYRESRSHNDFLCKLKTFASSKESLIEKLHRELSHHFELIEVSLKDISWTEHRKSVSWL